MANDYLELQKQIADDVSKFTWNPLGHAMYAYPWGREGTYLEDVQGPRNWQVEELSAIALHLSDPAKRHKPYQCCVSSGHGVGKSALIGMISKWALDTCADTRIVITANTDTQLKTKTVPEVMKWHRLAITNTWFELHTTAIYARNEHEKSWRLDFVPWSEHNTEAFAGLHNKGKRLLIIMDEGSAIIDKIWEVTEGALTDENTEILWIVFGNPTRNIGRFRECFRKYSKWWRHKKIDSRTVEGINLEVIQGYLEQHGGEDSDFFRVRVRGEFPNSSVRQFFATELIEAAQKRVLKRQQFEFAPVIISCDPAWTGDDDLVISIRQGLSFRVLEVHPKNDNDVLIANKIARLQDEHDADVVFIDGGFGTGIVSVGKTMNRNWQLVWFAEKSGRVECLNKRAEMLVNVHEWLKEGGSIPEDDSELYEELLAMETLPTLDGKFKFLSKDDIRAIIYRSSGRLDSLSLTFAYPVQAKIRPGDVQGLHKLHQRRQDYDPMDEMDEI